MTMQVTKSEGGYLFGEKLFFGDMNQTGLINLKSHQGEVMHYGANIDKLVEYPGEYDIDGIMIQAMMDASTKELNYVITTEDKKIAIIQTAKILDKGEFGAIDEWYYMDTQASQKLEQMEVEGEKIDLLSLV